MSNLIHRARVERVIELTPGMVRVVLGGAGLAGFETTGVGDEYLRVWLPREGETEPTLPVPSGKDSWEWPEGVAESPLRTYTVRRWDAAARELTIDMVKHGAGLAARWAASARPGAIVGVNTPRGMYRPPAGMRWLLLATDAAGLPAAARILETLPPSVRVRAFLEVPGPEYEQTIALPARAEVRWLHGGNGHGPSRLAELVRASAFPDGPGYVWVAGETRVTRDARRYLRHELGWPSTAYKVVGYWTEAVEEWEARYEALPAEVYAHLESLWDDEDRDEEDIEDEYDAVLDRFGL
ncbi:MAG: siderophore-interacting protein, partial [Microbacterium sp.]